MVIFQKFIFWIKSRYSYCLYRNLESFDRSNECNFFKSLFWSSSVNFVKESQICCYWCQNSIIHKLFSLFQYFCKAMYSMYSMYLGFHSPQQSSSYDICNQNINAKITLHSLLWQKNMHSLGHRASMGLKKYWMNEKKELEW